MELSIGEMLMIVLVIVVLFGPDKLPTIAREFGQGIRKMRGAVEDIKTEILKEADNPLSDIKKEIEKVKEAAQDFNPVENIKRDILSEPNGDIAQNEPPKAKPQDDPQYEGPVSR